MSPKAWLRWALLPIALQLGAGTASARKIIAIPEELPPALERVIEQTYSTPAVDRAERLAVYGGGAVYVVVEQGKAVRVTSTYERSGTEWRLIHRHTDPAVNAPSRVAEIVPRCGQASRASSANEASQCSPM